MRGGGIEAKSLRKAVVPTSLIPNPSPASFQSNRLALHVSPDSCCCSIYVASGCHTYNLEISVEDSSLTKGKESLLIPQPAQVLSSSIVDRCPHRSEVQSVVLSETDCDGCLVLGTVDSHGHLLVSRLVTTSPDFDGVTYSVLPRDSGVGEGSWAGLCFSPSQWSTAAVAHSFGKSIDVYDQEIHIRSLHTWSALSRWMNCSKYEITGLAFSSLDSDYIYVQGVDYEVFCGNWRDNKKVFSFRGDSNWLGFSKCSSNDTLGGWCDSGSIFVADVVEKGLQPDNGTADGFSS
ncbi:hypothetical protein IFM89_022309 [Coptis chinensis]|uniref:Uncharacterized protein n=1 Tax=Coptis chinensis TaxID=261450 RepID=A0A835I5K5_9MAGN|nr:hypothetical protein IFM89_022309 [Coptis chinensis]